MNAMDTLFRDLIYAARGLRKNLGFAAVAYTLSVLAIVELVTDQLPKTLEIVAACAPVSRAPSATAFAIASMCP